MMCKQFPHRSHLAAGHLVLLDPLGEEGGGVLRLDAGRHNHGPPLPPVHRSRHTTPDQRKMMRHFNIIYTLDKTTKSFVKALESFIVEVHNE